MNIKLDSLYKNIYKQLLTYMLNKYQKDKKDKPKKVYQLLYRLKRKKKRRLMKMRMITNRMISLTSNSNIDFTQRKSKRAESESSSPEKRIKYSQRRRD